MVLLDNADENVYERHQELCVNLNMDKDTAEEAWQNYETIRQNYTLEVSVSSMFNVNRFYYFVT
jgi:retinoblastoma-like protein 1